MNMNKVLVAVGLLSASMAFGQTTPTTNSSSTNTSTGSTTNRNATTGSSSGTSGSMGTGTKGTGTTGTSGTYNNSTGTTTSGTMGTGSTGTSTMGTTGTGSTGTTGTYNSNGTYNNSTTVTPSGSSNYNTMGSGSTGTGSVGTSGATTTTPSTSGSYNTNTMGTGSTGTSTYNSSQTTTTTRTRSDDPAGKNGYNNFVFGIYAGLNTTRFRGESIDTENPAGRIGYQAGLFLRGGGRLFGQVGAEYFASSSNYFRPNDGQTVAAIRDQINIQYIQVPVYIGYKIVDSPKGNSAIRVQAGVEYANRINSNSNSFNLSNDEIKSGSFNALGLIGFDAGPFLLDLRYHYGLGNAVQITNFSGSSRRILSASVGFKF